MENVLSLAEIGAATFGSVALALVAAKACLGGLFRAMAGHR
jgi:hypothetical protein